MARARKTWTEKLAEAKVKLPEPRLHHCEKTGQQFQVPAAADVEQLARGVPRGKLTTMKQMTDTLQARHGGDFCCPLVTGIVMWLVANAADEAEQLGKARVVPWWRVLKTDGKLNPKYPGKGQLQRERLEAEGHRVTAKGKHLVVEDFAKALVGSAPAPKAKAAAEMERKVLHRGDFGLCLLLPKTEWKHLPDCGPARVAVDGTVRRVTVQIEPCNCQGDGWHEHRFLSLPASTGAKAGDRVKVRFGA
jgi:hypothetical protein